MAPIAVAQGFKSVRHMLVETEGENPTTMSSDDEDIQEEEEESQQQLPTTMPEAEENETNSEKPDDVEVASVNSESDVSVRKAKLGFDSAFFHHFGHKLGYDEIFFENHCKFPE